MPPPALNAEKSFDDPEAGVNVTPSPRVRIRELTRDDETEYLSLVDGSVRFHERWIKNPRDSETFKRYLSRFEDGDSRCFVVCHSDSGSIVGFISLTGIEREPYHRGRLGYGIFEPFARRGYILEGLKNVIQYAFAELGLHRLEADIQPGNTPSKQLVQKLGFTYECTSPGFIKINDSWTDHERWALTCEQWKPPVEGLPQREERTDA
jgi:ribosomal-protein-alanine N-acetyltransferase